MSTAVVVRYRHENALIRMLRLLLCSALRWSPSIVRHLNQMRVAQKALQNESR